MPKPLKIPLVAGVLVVFEAAELVAPNVNGVDAGADVAGAFGAPLVVPNRPPEGAALEVPNIPPTFDSIQLMQDYLPPQSLSPLQ